MNLFMLLGILKLLLPFLEKSEADLSPLLPWISPPLAMHPMIVLCFVSPHTFFGAWQFSGLFCEPPSTCSWYLQHNPAGRTVQGPWQPAASNPEAKMLPSPLVQLCRIQVDFYGFLTVSDGRIWLLQLYKDTGSADIQSTKSCVQFDGISEELNSFLKFTSSHCIKSPLFLFISLLHHITGYLQILISHLWGFILFWLNLPSLSVSNSLSSFPSSSLDSSPFSNCLSLRI